MHCTTFSKDKELKDLREENEELRRATAEQEEIGDGEGIVEEPVVGFTY